VVDQARSAESDGVESVVAPAQLDENLGDVVDESIRADRRRHLVIGHDRAVIFDDNAEDLGAADIDPDRGQRLEPQECADAPEHVEIGVAGANRDPA
jgi:hypothetical protein